MSFRKSSRSTPVFKQIVKLRENVQHRIRIVRLKKRKWIPLVRHVKRYARWWKRGTTRRNASFVVTRKPSKWCSYREGKHRMLLFIQKRFKLLYGGFTKKRVKKTLYEAKKKIKQKDIKLALLELYENRLDTVLYRARFCRSIRTARQLIAHGKAVKVNEQLVKRQTFTLRRGDRISIVPKYYKMVDKHIAKAFTWPFPPKHLTINYKIYQIVVNSSLDSNISTNYTFNLNLGLLLTDCLRR